MLTLQADLSMSGLCICPSGMLLQVLTNPLVTFSDHTQDIHDILILSLVRNTKITWRDIGLFMCLGNMCVRVFIFCQCVLCFCFDVERTCWVLGDKQRERRCNVTLDVKECVKRTTHGLLTQCRIQGSWAAQTTPACPAQTIALSLATIQTKLNN